MNVPILDLQQQYAQNKNELLGAVTRVLESGTFVLGDEVANFESQLAQYLGVEHVIGVGNGSDALVMALMAECIGPGDEVITTPFSFFATAGSIARVGAKPVFVDIDEDTYNINPFLVEAAITERTKAIIGVDLYGHPADWPELAKIAKKHGLILIDDAAQSIGARIDDKPIGLWADYTTISFFPTKNLGAYGDAGAVITQTSDAAERVRMIRVHGSKKKYYHEMVGLNSRLDAIQAAILSVKLSLLSEATDTRRKNAAFYTERLVNVQTPIVRQGAKHVFHQYTIRTTQRDELQAFLSENNIDSVVYYPLCLHLQECFSSLGYQHGDLPVAERASEQVLSIPIHEYLSSEQLAFVVEKIQEFYDRQ